MRPLDRAFEDIKLGITSDIVHKYLLVQAPDIRAIVNLAKICNKYDRSLFPWAAIIAHTMVNPSVIDNLIFYIEKHAGDRAAIFNEIMHPDVKAQWNTPEFHAQMKAVTTDYQVVGGYQAEKTRAGIAAQMFACDLTPLLRMLELWLYKETTADEEALIQGIYQLQMPGMDFDATKLRSSNIQERVFHQAKEYWLLHFVRWMSFVRQHVLHLPTIESPKYLSMIGVQKFRAHYQTGGEPLSRDDMLILFEMTKSFVADFNERRAIPAPEMTYGDFACLLCETHRMLDQLSKELRASEDDVRKILKDSMDKPAGRENWLAYKRAHMDRSLGGSVIESARYNAGLFAKTQRPQEPVRVKQTQIMEM